MARYFKMSELVYSDTAVRCGIDNTPSGDVISHLNELMLVLDDLRSFVGRPIRVTSGYRCPLLNRRVGGVSNSAHLYGYAADLYPVDMDFVAFIKLVRTWAYGHTDIFDQCIIERSGSSRWVHLSICGVGGCRRGQVFSIDK